MRLNSQDCHAPLSTPSGPLAEARGPRTLSPTSIASADASLLPKRAADKDASDDDGSGDDGRKRARVDEQ